MILEAKNILFSYKKGSRILYDNFNIAIENHECVGLAAPSGFGKTTLCKILSGYESPKSGEVLLDGKPIADYKGYCPVQMIWQHPENAVDPKQKMKHILKEAGDISPHIIKGLSINENWLDRFPAELSGGELQRFCIARALSEHTKFILADEMTTMLDLVSQAEVWSFLLAECKKREIGLLVVSHLPSLLDHICTRQINLFTP